MKQKLYQKPTMKVVKLSHKSQILAGSGEQGGAQRENYESLEW